MTTKLQRIAASPAQALSPGPYWKVENGKLVVTKEFTVTNGVKGKTRVLAEKELTIPVGFKSDGYTGVIDCPDELPAIVHDAIYEGQRTWDDGTPISFEDANNLLYYLMSISTSWITRRLAYTYWLGVTLFGLMFWRDQVKFSVKGIFTRKPPFGGLPLKMA